MILHIVTGAPGAGKSTSAEAFLALQTNYVAFDSDWLIGSASELAQRDIHTDPTTWPAYGKVWSDVLHAAVRNGISPLFFVPNTPEDLEPLKQQEWCTGLRWLLLDCPDAVRRERLAQRNRTDEAKIQEAIEDAAELRDFGFDTLDTSQFNPSEIAQQLFHWLK